jgi:hypothetical protein
MFVALATSFQTYLHFSLVAITQNFGLAKYETLYMSFKLIGIIMYVQAMNFLAALLFLLMPKENVL